MNSSKSFVSCFGLPISVLRTPSGTFQDRKEARSVPVMRNIVRRIASFGIDGLDTIREIDLQARALARRLEFREERDEFLLPRCRHRLEHRAGHDEVVGV